MAILTRSVAPTVTPVDSDAVLAGLRIDSRDEVDLIDTLIQAATDDAENRLHRAILPQTWVMTLDGFPGGPIRLPWPVAHTVTVAYQATAGVWTTLSAEAVTLATGTPSAVIPAYGQSWPPAIAHVDGVRITFTAYSWATAAAVPAGIRQWIIARVGELFEQREASGPVQLYGHPFLAGLLAPWIIPDYGYRSGA
jgi:uncharacterized phiE125 gp8 family phage protein